MKSLCFKSDRLNEVLQRVNHAPGLSEKQAASKQHVWPVSRDEAGVGRRRAPSSGQAGPA
jgi:hypothetical protein